MTPSKTVPEFLGTPEGMEREAGLQEVSHEITKENFLIIENIMGTQI